MRRSQLFVIGAVLVLGLLLGAYRQTAPGVRNIPPGPTVILSYPFEKPGIFQYGISIPGYQIGGLKDDDHYRE